MKWTFFFVLTFPLSFLSQVLDNSEGLAFSEFPFFNSKAIKAAKIHQFKGKYNFKKPGAPMVETSLDYVYTFDIEGNLIHFFEEIPWGKKRDTSVFFYTYTAQNQLASMRRRDGQNFLHTFYTYDSLGRVIWRKTVKEIRVGGTLLEPEIETRDTIQIESYRYEKSAEIVKKTSYNRAGNPYQLETKTEDSIQQKTTVDLELLMNSSHQLTTFQYSKSKLLLSKTIENKGFSETFQYKYDEKQNLISIQRSENGMETYETQVIYNYQTDLLSSFIFYDIRTKIIRIIRFENYVYFE